MSWISWIVVWNNEIKNLTNSCHDIYMVTGCRSINEYTYKRKYNFPSKHWNWRPRMYGNDYNTFLVSSLNWLMSVSMFYLLLMFYLCMLKAFWTLYIIMDRRMVVGITTTYVWSVPITNNVVSSNPVHGEVYSIQHINCDQVCQWLAAGRWFSPVSSTNKIKRHDIAEILLKVELNTKKP